MDPKSGSYRLLMDYSEAPASLEKACITFKLLATNDTLRISFPNLDYETSAACRSSLTCTDAFRINTLSEWLGNSGVATDDGNIPAELNELRGLILDLRANQNDYSQKVESLSQFKVQRMISAGKIPLWLTISSALFASGVWAAGYARLKN